VAFWREMPGLQWILTGITVLFSWLLVSPVKLIALKFKSFSLKANWARYVLLLVSAAGIALFTYKAVPGIIVIYFVLSVVDGVMAKRSPLSKE
jgi:CDP-diacylglycerol--serine O-phosphatidyltransferase